MLEVVTHILIFVMNVRETVPIITIVLMDSNAFIGVHMRVYQVVLVKQATVICMVKTFVMIQAKISPIFDGETGVEITNHVMYALEIVEMITIAKVI